MAKLPARKLDLATADATRRWMEAGVLDQPQPRLPLGQRLCLENGVRHPIPIDKEKAVHAATR